MPFSDFSRFISISLERVRNRNQMLRNFNSSKFYRNMYSLRFFTQVYLNNIFFPFDSLQVNASYDEYLKKFYPHQEENVHTNNNWTLSDEFVELVNSDIFYAEHVRWNITRFRPSDMITEEANVNEQTDSTTDAEKILDDDNAIEERSEHSSSAAGIILVPVCPMSLRSKRKASANESNIDRIASTQTRSEKRNRLD